MKFAFSLLLLATYAYAGPIVRDAHIQSTSADKPAVIVGSSQVDSKAEGGKVTLHLDQRSQIGKDIIPVAEKVAPQPEAPIVSEPKPIEEVKQIVPVSVPVPAVEQPKEQPILTGRSQPVAQDGVKVPERQVVQNPVPVPEKPLLVVEEVPAVLPVEPAIVVVAPQVPVASEIPIPPVPQPAVPEVFVPEQIPQTFIQPVSVPEVPQVVVEVPAQMPVPVVPVGQPSLEERSTASQVPISTILAAQEVVIPKEPVVEVAQPIQEKVELRNSVPVKEPAPVEIKPIAPVETSARNFKVEQTPVKAPVVISTVQKQVASVDVKSETPKLVVPSQEVKLESKHAIVPEVKPQPAVQSVKVVEPVQVPSTGVKHSVEQQVPKIALEERKSEPAQIQPVIVAVQPIAEQIPVQQPVVPEIRKEAEPLPIIPVQPVPVIAVPVQEPVLVVIPAEAQPKPVQPQVAVPVVQPEQPQVQSVTEPKSQ